MSKIIVRNMRLHPLIFSLILDRNVEKYIGCENKKLFTLIFFYFKNLFNYKIQ